MNAQPVDPSKLLSADWHPNACPDGLIDAWRQIHYAAQVASEIGKSWAAPQPDDSHSNFGWSTRHGGFVSVATATDGPLHGTLDLSTLTLGLVPTDGAPLDTFACNGHKLGDAFAWLDQVATEHAGPRLQPSVPAPDLPDHAVADGAAFKTNASFAAVSDWYANADSLLTRLVPLLPNADAARCWPHHLDHATLSIVRTDEQGGMTATIGVGLTPPDSFEASGYWYVSPWLRDAANQACDWDQLPAGRWSAREGAPPMGVLPLTEIAGVSDASTQQQLVADFVSVACNLCLKHL